MHPGTESEEGHSGSRWTHEFADANVCKWGCKRLHPRLQIFAPGGSTISFYLVTYCRTARNEPQNSVPPPATSVFAAWEASSSGLRGHFMPYSGALKCKWDGHRSLMTDSAGTLSIQSVSKNIGKKTKCQDRGSQYRHIGAAGRRGIPHTVCSEVTCSIHPPAEPIPGEMEM